MIYSNREKPLPTHHTLRKRISCWWLRPHTARCATTVEVQSGLKKAKRSYRSLTYFPKTDSHLNTTSITLLHRIRSADSVAWNRFVDLYTPLIFRWARSRGLNVNDAADLTQDIFATLLQKLPDFRYDQAKSFRAWLKTITLNRCSDLFRKQKLSSGGQASERVHDIADETSDIEFLTEQEYNQFVATRALQLMKNEFESTTWQACWQSITTDLTALQIAENLGITVNAVYLAKSRVLRRLRQQLAGLLD